MFSTIMFIVGFILGGFCVPIAFYFFFGDEDGDGAFEADENDQPARKAVIEKIEEGKFFVYDKITGSFLCKFTSWSKLPEQLGEWDPNVDWIVEHSYPEIDRKKVG